MKKKKYNFFFFLRPNDSISEDAFSPNLEILDGESVDIVQGADIQFKGYSDDISTINPLDSIHQQSKNQYYDSGDSDDYTECDNWINKGKLNVIQERESKERGKLSLDGI